LIFSFGTILLYFRTSLTPSYSLSQQLPIFGLGDEPTADLTALAFCMIDPTDGAAVRAGYSMGCSALITIAKIVVTGLSLGTGIIGGHFWGPLFTGAAAAHFFSDLVKWLGLRFGLNTSLAAYPCVVILCTMASTHVVTFRAHMAIMLILTLTISAFDPEEGSDGSHKVAGDYSAVFPLLVVSVFISLMVRDCCLYHVVMAFRRCRHIVIVDLTHMSLAVSTTRRRLVK
jgi:hypothetical protein